MNKKLGILFNYYFDCTLPFINSLIFTFYRKTLAVYEVRSDENWYWTITEYIISNRNLKFDYNDRVGFMIFGEFCFRVFKFICLGLTFAFISLVNALMIRVTIKTSVVVAFLYFKVEDLFMRRERIDINSRTYVY